MGQKLSSARGSAPMPARSETGERRTRSHPRRPTWTEPPQLTRDPGYAGGSDVSPTGPIATPIGHSQRDKPPAILLEVPMVVAIPYAENTGALVPSRSGPAVPPTPNAAARSRGSPTSSLLLSGGVRRPLPPSHTLLSTRWIAVVPPPVGPAKRPRRTS